MKKENEKRKIPWYVYVLLLLAVAGAFWMRGSVQGTREKALKREIRKIPAEMTEVRLNDLVPFEWDTVYAFGAYEPESAIHEVIGVEDGRIEEGVSEGQMQIVFVDHQEESVAANFCGYPEKFGFLMEFPEEWWGKRDCMITKEENAVFTVTKEDGLVTLTYKQSDAAAL